MYNRVATIVISAHLLFMALLLFTPTRLPVKKTAHVKVRTVRPMARSTLTPSSPSSKTTSTRASPPTSKPSVNKPAASKKLPPPPSSKASRPYPQKTPPSRKPAVVEKGKVAKKKSEPSPEIWKDIDQALAKIEKKSYPSPELPSFLDEIKNLEENRDKRAVADLQEFLHETLCLPDVGSVTVEITLRKDGTVAKMAVINSESHKNRLYLEEHLPQLHLPIHLEQEKTIKISFHNGI